MNDAELIVSALEHEGVQHSVRLSKLFPSLAAENAELRPRNGNGAGALRLADRRSEESAAPCER
jgi:hypothetical protein